MKKLTGSLLFMILGNAMLIAFLVDNHKTARLNEIYQETWQEAALKKYQWKSERLATYTDLVYNVNKGAVYEK